MMREYPKIPGPYKRHAEGLHRNEVIIGEWSDPVFEYLQDREWVFTEKVDGTNIRVHWDGHTVTFGGRTDRAQIPTKLFERLVELFPEELFEQTFQDSEVTLYGEGYGAGIQKGGVYSPKQDFILFDVRIGNWWLLRADVEEIAIKLGIDIVPIMMISTLNRAIDVVREGLMSNWGNFPAEGLVGTTAPGLLDRSGHRIIVKIKAVDFGGR